MTNTALPLRIPDSTQMHTVQVGKDSAGEEGSEGSLSVADVVQGGIQIYSTIYSVPLRQEVEGQGAFLEVATLKPL